MKKIFVAVLLAGALSWASNAFATPVTFDVEGGPESYVNILGSASIGGDIDAILSSELVTMDNFELLDNESYTFDFFTLQTTTDYEAAIGVYAIEANLSFVTPNIDANSTGLGLWVAVQGYFNAGLLYWSNPVQEFTLSNGTSVEVAFEQGFYVDSGSSYAVSATVTNLGGAAPVPEPSTIILFGAGIIGLAGYSRTRSKKN